MTHKNDHAFAMGSMNTTQGSATDGDHFEHQPGLTKREYFAARAMQGLLASYAGATKNPEPTALAWKATEYADELIYVLNKQL